MNQRRASFNLPTVKKRITTFAVNFYNCQLSKDDSLLLLVTTAGWCLIAAIYVAAIAVALMRE